MPVLLSIPSIAMRFRPALYFQPEFKPNPKLYAVVPKATTLVTTTAYPVDPKTCEMHADWHLRARLSLQMFRDARDLDYEVVCVDAKSDPGWRQKVKDLGVHLLDEDLKQYPGAHFIGRSRRQGLDAAANLHKNRFIISWLEPEKHPYVKGVIAVPTGSFSPNGYLENSFAYEETSPLAMTLTPIYEEIADCIVPRRIDHASRYPPQAQLEELMCNFSYQESIQGFFYRQTVPRKSPYLDMQVGPKSCHRDLLDFLLRFNGFIKTKEKDGTIKDNPHDRWEATFMGYWAMLLAGKRVGSVAVPYFHPEEQSASEYGKPDWNKKRIDQAVVITSALDKFLDNFDLNRWWEPKAALTP